MQSFRPKHQVLVLKCYPKFQKNVVDVKPNSSELSYLLYYASTRRSKVQKVGAFLEKKTASDVYRVRNGNVQVTLEILRALIDKSPRDLPLYAPYVLRIFEIILRSKDLNMVEDSLPAFETFCAHQDVATLAADQEHIKHYERIVTLYASAAAMSPMQLKGPLSAPITIRWRNAGLRAIKSITSSEAVGADGGKQLNIVIPMILQNLHSDDGDYLSTLQRRDQANEKLEKEGPLRRRMSVATVQGADTTTGPNAAVVSDTTADADRVAEEEVGLLALQSLKQIFVTNYRYQLRNATTAILRFIAGKITTLEISKMARTDKGGGTWATSLMEMVTRWAPVQDRFVILVTAIESLIRSPVTEENLQQQLMLVSLAGWLLSSDINMIGLSVMDVLLGLIQHVLALLQLSGRASSLLPLHQQVDAIELFHENPDILNRPSSTAFSSKEAIAVDETSPSAARQELLAKLRKSIGDLATHIYYSDQISDMISAILLRLKPSPSSGVPTAIAAVERPAAAAQAISSTAHLRERPHGDEFFSFGTARVTALNAIKDVLGVANAKGSATGAGAIGRNRVSVQVWEGTQWLLRDDDRRVRRAYVDALSTWLKLEMSGSDLRVLEDKHAMSIANGMLKSGAVRASSLTRRAASSASQKNKKTKVTKSTFLQLLHLAVYDNGIESPESDSDIALLHLLLANLVEKLGVNAAKSGLPMILRLQEDINDDKLLGTPIAKVNVGSLVHGYFWILSEKFDFDATMVGYEIHNEISRRKKHGLWLDSVRLPPLPLDQTLAASLAPSSERAPLEVLRKESLRPFDSSPAIVEQIARAYASSAASPPNSPPNSPGRVFSMPVLSPGRPAAWHTYELPSNIKEAMLSSWSKDQCIASVETGSSRAASLNGSRTGTQGATNGHAPGTNSPERTRSPLLAPLSNKRSQEDGQQSPANPYSSFSLQNDRLRRPSGQDTGSRSPMSSSEAQTTLHVDDLKRVLAGGALAGVFATRDGNGSAMRTPSPLRNSSVAYQDFAGAPRPGHHSISTGSESIVSAEGFESASEGDLSQPLPPPQSPIPAHDPLKRLSDQGPGVARSSGAPQRAAAAQDHKARPASSSSAGEDPEANSRALKGELVRPSSMGSGRDQDDDEVPPVPPLPPSVSRHSNVGLGPRRGLRGGVFDADGAAARPMTAPNTQEKLRLTDGSVDGARSGRASLRSENRRQGKPVDFRRLLNEIDVGPMDRGGGVGRPPY